MLRDLIKVNGYVSLGLASFCLFQMIVVLNATRHDQSRILEQVKAAQPAGQQMSKEVLLKFTHFMLWFLMAYSSLLIIHTILTFRLLKRYREVFESPAK